MSELFDKSIRTLELPQVLQLLSEQAVSPEAKELALAVRPETDYEDVLRLLDQTDGARAMIVLRGAPGSSTVSGFTGRPAAHRLRRPQAALFLHTGTGGPKAAVRCRRSLCLRQMCIRDSSGDRRMRHPGGELCKAGRDFAFPR